MREGTENLYKSLKNLGYMSIPFITSATGAITGYILTGSIPIAVSVGLLGILTVPYVNRKIYLERMPERTVEGIFNTPLRDILPKEVAEEVCERFGRPPEPWLNEIKKTAEEIHKQTEMILKR